MFYKKIYLTSLLIFNNFIYNFYLICNILLPKYFKDRVTNIKELNDSYYKDLFLIIFMDEMHEKYDIDIMKFTEMYNDFINNINNNSNNSNNEDDKNSIISEINSISSSLHSSFCDEFEVQEAQEENPFEFPPDFQRDVYDEIR